MKTEIIPAILEINFNEILKKINLVKKEVDFVQIDICDGKFVPSKTFASNGRIDSAKKIQKLKKKINLELDMMVDFDKHFKKWINFIKIIKPSRVVLHYGSIKNWEKIFEELKDIEIALGVQIQHKEKDYFKLFEKYNFDYIQFMGIEKIGYGGQKLTAKVYKKTNSFRGKKPKVPVQVDGGVKIYNGEKLKENGVNRFVSGSGVFGEEDIQQVIELFKKI